MVGPLGKVVSPFRPTTRKRGGDRTTTRRLTSGPELEAWPDCWVSVEFLHAAIHRKGSDSTTTRLIQSCQALKLNSLICDIFLKYLSIQSDLERKHFKNFYSSKAIFLEVGLARVRFR